MTPPPRSLAAPLCVSALLLTACPSGSIPLPEGPPPEYEPPRAYAPDKNIDGHESGGDAPLETSPPPVDTDGGDPGADDPDDTPPPPPAPSAAPTEPPARAPR